MDANIKAQWVAALRSGEYKQAKHVLHNTQEDSYCCLGVLCDLAVKAGVHVPRSDTVVSMHLDGRMDIPAEYFGDMTQVLPGLVSSWSGIDDEDPTVNEDGDSLAKLNDGGWSFEQIADLIEAEF